MAGLFCLYQRPGSSNSIQPISYRDPELIAAPTDPSVLTTKMQHLEGLSFTALEDKDLREATPLVYPPRGLIPKVITIDNATALWSSAVGHPEVAVLLQQRICTHWRMPPNVAALIASFTMATVFFLRCNRGLEPYWEDYTDEQPTAIKMICFCAWSDDHANDLRNALFCAPHPETNFRGFLRRLDTSGRPSGIPCFYYCYHGSTLLLTPSAY